MKTFGLAILCFAFFLGALAVPFAGAQTQKPDYDLNGDGTVTLEEAEKVLGFYFDQSDLNKNGIWTKKEATTAAEAALKQQGIPQMMWPLLTGGALQNFSSADLNGDGVVPKAEFVESSMRVIRARLAERGVSAPAQEVPAQPQQQAPQVTPPTVQQVIPAAPAPKIRQQGAPIFLNRGE